MAHIASTPIGPLQLQASVALGAGFGFFAGLPGVGIILGGIIDAHGSRWASAAVSLLAGVALCVLGVAHWRHAIPDRLVEWAPGGVAVILAVQSAGHLVTTGEPQFTVFLLLGIVSTGATVPRWWLLIAVDMVLAVAYVLAATGVGHSRRLDLPAVPLIVSVLMGVSLFSYHSSGRRQLHALTEKIGQLAIRDPLTGLLNRRGLNDGLPASGTDASIIAVICVDVNGFKDINDELGHLAGDVILCTVADRLSHLVRTKDLVARTGGDEFLVVAELPDEQAVDRLRERVTEQLAGTAGVLQLPWSVSVGSAWRLRTPDSNVLLDPLIREADLAMYEDKRRHQRDRRARADLSSD